MRILVVEDEPTLNRLIADTLRLAHYVVDACPDGEDALAHMACAEYDAVVLDIMLPKVDGLTILRRLRSERNRTPVLLLTAKDSVEDRVTGLDSGADDYLVKPFAFSELLARTRVMLRRSADSVDDILSLADLTMDCKARTAARSQEPVSLSSREFDILEYLLRNKGFILSRDKISSHVWNYDGASNVVDVYIRYLRKKIDENREPKLIHTIRGAGYVLRV
ncbi:OmpR family two-component response regulator [Oscillibacter valericigenes Sjm18-20]|nr:OmpR family two-component response regulator [Oscillibacter valericigenes Sjm18-20]